MRVFQAAVCLYTLFPFFGKLSYQLDFKTRNAAHFDKGQRFTVLINNTPAPYSTLRGVLRDFFIFFVNQLTRWPTCSLSHCTANQIKIATSENIRVESQVFITWKDDAMRRKWTRLLLSLSSVLVKIYDSRCSTCLSSGDWNSLCHI